MLAMLREKMAKTAAVIINPRHLRGGHCRQMNIWYGAEHLTPANRVAKVRSAELLTEPGPKTNGIIEGDHQETAIRYRADKR